jgi:hypothetical protein
MSAGDDRTLGDIALEGRERVPIECDKCERFESFPLHLLVEAHGKRQHVRDIVVHLTADCPKRLDPSVLDPCGARCAEPV